MVPNAEFGIVLAGAASLQQATKSQLDLNNFIASQMVEEVDYGKIPGTPKKSLWQPGAHKLLFFNGLGVRLEPTSGTIVDWDKAFWHYEFKAIAFHKQTGLAVAECVGSANSKESRYRYNWVGESRIPRGIKKEDLESKEKNGFTLYRIENPELFSLPNTLVKMAQKRAVTGVTLLACRASENFTQEVGEEDLPHEDRIAKAKPVSSKVERTAAPAEHAEIVSDGSVRFIPANVTTKNGEGAKGPWTKYGIKSPSGEWYGTFNKELGALAQQAKANQAEIEVEFKVDGEYKNVVTLKLT